MEKQHESLNEGKVNAGRGIAKDLIRDNDANLVEDNVGDNDRPDERARKAGY